MLLRRCVAQCPLGFRNPLQRALSTRLPSFIDRNAAPNAPPSPEERMVVLFPRSTSHKASLEVKKRILYSVPHMGGKKLKALVRKHARQGTKESFIGEFESRLDRFIYRCNLVTSIFAARQARPKPRLPAVSAS